MLFLDNEGAQERARVGAEAKLQKELAAAVDWVPCPDCGWYQSDMCEKSKRFRNRLGIGVCVLGAVVTAVVAGLYTDRRGHVLGVNVGDNLWYVCGSLLVLGIPASMAWASWHDANADHPGRGGRHPERASGSRGKTLAEIQEQQEEEELATSKAIDQAILTAMLAVAVADGEPADGEIALAVELFAQITGNSIKVNDARKRTEEIATQRSLAEGALRAVAGRLTDEGKSLVLRAAYTVAAADGEVTKKEAKVMNKFAETLGMDQASVNAAIST
ncbi:MAG: TerB family tellurite resistance protein [Lacipirellulaceae bacterium]